LPPIAVTVWVITPALWIQAVVTFICVFTAMTVTPKIERWIRDKRAGSNGRSHGT
jgi:hypothetical protein